MKKIQKNKRMLLHKGIKICTFFAIALFSVIIINLGKVDASSFKYSEFDWETFYQKKKFFWEQSCKNTDGTIDENCESEIIKSQEKFYTKLYKLLAKQEARGLYIRDDIILETVFYELSPSQFSDDGLEYSNEYGGKGIYAIDETDLQDPVVDVDYTSEEALTYFENETDTVKTLVQNMIAYTTSCYGIYGTPTKHTTEEGDVYYTCDNGGTAMQLPIRGHKCADTLQASNSMGFWEYYVSKLEHDESLPWYQQALNVMFLGRSFEDPYYNICKNNEASYTEGAFYNYNDVPEVNTDRYFDFLSYNIYFDKKAHLQVKFKETVLDPAGVECMTNDVCEDSLENLAGGYEKYEGEIILVRREIIGDIISILNAYNTDESLKIYYDPVTGGSYDSGDSEQAARKSFYWPIGSDETEVRNGVTYADKAPASNNVISRFGQRENPITHEVEQHYGIDISGEEGITNVIAVYRGEVLSVVSSCSKGDYSCNEGYGNMIIISHSNGDYTVYAHLSSIDSAITVGTSVDKGQLIGKVGATGETNTPCLHYELRKGGNSVENAIDPLNETNPENPRPEIAAGDFSVHETSLTREEFIKGVTQYCNKSKCDSQFLKVFVANAGLVYDESIKNDVNPELVVVRAKKEGLSPGGNTNNYWGIGCYNGAGKSACHTYASLEAGIKGFAKVVSPYDTVLQMMSKYAYIGDYWMRVKSNDKGLIWSDGGCVYYPYMKEFLSLERQSYVESACNTEPLCDSIKGGTGCDPTNDEDQTAYAMFNSKEMVDTRYVMFGL